MTDSIDVWRIHPFRRAGDFAALKSILPAQEIARAERHSDSVKQRASVTSRAILRLILSHYTRVPANQLSFVAGTNGKPHLELTQNESGITFNFSDSGEMALVAVGRKLEVGVDIERVREVERAMEIALRRFNPDSAAELERAPDQERSRAFLQKWARHEALLKARAGTIWHPSGDTSTFAVSGTTAQPPFTVSDVDTGADYVGAVAAPATGWTVNVRDYSD